MTDNWGITCYKQDEVKCSDTDCVRNGCRLERADAEDGMNQRQAEINDRMRGGSAERAPGKMVTAPRVKKLLMALEDIAGANGMPSTIPITLAKMAIREWNEAGS